LRRRSDAEAHKGGRIPIFPLHTLLLPHTDLGVHVFEAPYRALVAHSLQNGHTFGVVLRERSIGTLAKIGGYARLPDGRYLLELEGTRRFEVTSQNHNGSYPTARVRFIPEHIGNFARARAASDDAECLLAELRARRGDADLPLRLPVDPVMRSYLIASLLRIDTDTKQGLLEIDAADERLEAEATILEREIHALDELRSERV